LAYKWQTERGSTSSTPAFPWYGWNEKPDEEILGLVDWAFCVRLDQTGRVVQIQTLRATGTNDLSEAVLGWARENNRSSGPGSADRGARIRLQNRPISSTKTAQKCVIDRTECRPETQEEVCRCRTKSGESVT
jgi:hypothetical protein